jgi:hypothetical protein
MKEFEEQPIPPVKQKQNAPKYVVGRFLSNVNKIAISTMINFL